MSRRLPFLLAAVPALFSIADSASAQFGSNVIRGQVSGGSQYSYLSAEAYDTGQHRTVERTDLTSDGSFELRVAQGTFEVRIADRSGDILARGYITPGDAAPFLSIRLPQLQETRPVSGSISLTDLARQNNKPLMKEFAASTEAARRGDLRKAVAHLEKVVSMDPGFVIAYVNLGARYAQRGQHLSARAALLRAIELDPKCVNAYTNLAIADLLVDNLEGAEVAAQAALRLEPGNDLAPRILARTRR